MQLEFDLTSAVDQAVKDYPVLSILNVEVRNEQSKYTQRRGRGKSRIYFFIKGENILENLFERHFRPHKEYRKLLPAVLAKAGITTNEHIRWSQKAGCSCPCSPGFILGDVYGKTIYVDVTGGKKA